MNALFDQKEKLALRLPACKSKVQLGENVAAFLKLDLRAPAAARPGPRALLQEASDEAAIEACRRRLQEGSADERAIAAHRRGARALSQLMATAAGAAAWLRWPRRGAR